MYFKKLDELKEGLLTDLDNRSSRAFLLNLIITAFLGMLIGSASIICIIPVFILGVIDHIISGTINLYKFIKYGNLKKKRIKEVKAIIQEHGNKLLLADKKYLLQSISDGSVYILPKHHTLRHFIFDFLYNLNYQYNTYDLNYNFICYTRKRRSLGDIFLICKNYYPECTIEEVLTILIKLLHEKDLYASYCNTINKYVFHTDSNHWNRNDKTEYHKDLKFNELIEIYK